MIARRWFVSGVVLALLLPGCIVEKRDFDALREQVRLQQRQINDLKARQEEQALRVDTLNNGFKILGDKAEENARRIDEQAEREAQPAPQTAAPAPAPNPNPNPNPAPAAPLQASEAPVATPAPTPVEGPILITNLPKTPEPVPPPGGEIITAGPKPEKLYAGALSLYSGRDYELASAKFKEFVAVYPDHKLAGNAQYWIGECLYSQNRFAEAEEEFARVEKAYPASHKVPAALLKQGLSLEKLKRMPEAKATLQRIVEKYGQSEEAAKAKEKLERWKQP
jgi:tol-pal system protein YbgF